MTHRIGTVDLPPRMGMDRYFAELSALELSSTHAAPPKPSAVARWKAEAPAGSLVLAAPWVATHRKAPLMAKGWATDPAAGEFRDTPIVRAAMHEFAKVCAQLSPWAVIFPSPPLFSPSTGNRDRLRQFFAEVAPAEMFGGAQRVWIPDGLWEPLTAVRFASQLGITCAIDPLVTIPGTPADLHLHYETNDLYFRIHGIGRTRGLREDDLISIEELSAYYENAAFMIATMERWRDAKSIVQRLSEERTEVDPLSAGARRGGAALAFQRPAGAATGDGATALEGDELEDDELEDDELEDDELEDDELEDDELEDDDEDDEDDEDPTS
jgi:uncharacterized protein YecE (DUF72 family)